jgi:hypothetical protein
MNCWFPREEIRAMAIVVVGGSGRGVGKTSLVCGLIAAFPEHRWIAVKITGHLHGQRDLLWEETAPGHGTDTARYLAAGAQRAFLVTAVDEELPTDEIRAAVGSGAHVIFESNRIVFAWEPDLCIGVVGGKGTEIKPSFGPFLESADALVVGADGGDWQLPHLKAKVFRLADGDCVSTEMLDWVRARLDSLRVAPKT